MRTAFVFALLFAGCNGGGTYVPVDTDTESDTDTDTDADSDTDADTDTDPPGTDNDGDGWTVEEGDCNDDDIWMNPAWDEKEDDDKDNDCDGLVDEEFVAVQVLDVNTAGGPARFHTIDPFGELDATLDFSDFLGASDMADDPDGDGWWFTDGNQAGLYHVNAAGTVTEVWSDAETEYEMGMEPLGWFGLARHPDGYWLMTGADRLWGITDDGVATVIAEWDCLEGEEMTTDVCPLDVSVDRFTGEVGLFGYFGGFATWTEEGGFVLHVQDDIVSEIAPYYWSKSGRKDNGTWFVLGQLGATGETGVYKWDDGSASFVLKGDWKNEDYAPVDFVIEQGSGDFYFSANGGWYYTVQRMVADGSYMAELYTTLPDDPDRAFMAITVLQTHD